MKTIQVTQHEIQQAMKHSIHKSKKTYNRKSKHKNKTYD
jgi:hypothetical protein